MFSEQHQTQVQEEEQEVDIESLKHHEQHVEHKYNRQQSNSHVSSEIDTANTTLKSNPNAAAASQFSSSQSSQFTIEIIAQSVTQTSIAATQSIPPQAHANASPLNQQNIKLLDHKNEEFSPNGSIILLNKSTVLPQSLNTSQQMISIKSPGYSETSSPTRSVRSSKSNRSSILTIKPLSGSSRPSIEQDLRSANTLFEKKQSRYRFVKSWEDKRIQITSIFNNIFCNMSDNLVKIATQSNEFIDNLLCFLKDQQVQIAQFAKAPLTQVGEAYKYTPQLGNVSYPSLNRIVKQLQIIDTAGGSNHSEFTNYIDQNIIRPYLLGDKKNFNQKFEAFSASIKERKSKIVKLSKIAVTAYEEYTNLFKEMVQLQQKGKDIKKDFYYQEVVFMHHSYEHFENLREFGLQVVRFVEELEQLQMSRTKNIHQALSGYVKQRQDLIEGLESSDHIKVMLQQLQVDMQKSILDIEALLQPEQANYIKKCYSQDEINLPMLKLFASDFSLKGTSEKNLVVKEFTALQVEKDNNPKKEWKGCSIILTVDNYLIISPGMLDSFSKPSSIIFLPFSKSTFQKDQMIVTIIETQKKLFWKSKKSYHFKLQHEFDANEITSFLQNNTPNFSQNNTHNAHNTKQNNTLNISQNNTGNSSQNQQQ